MKRKGLGIVTGLLGNLLLGWGTYRGLGCGGEDPPCPDGLLSLALPVGMVVSVFSMFAGGWIIFFSTFATLGSALILRGINGGSDGDSTGPIVIGAIFLIPVVLALLMVPSVRRATREEQRLKAEGRKGIATVTAIEDTRTTINDNPHVELTLSIQPDGGGAPFSATKAVTVSRVKIPRAGDRYSVVYDPQDPAKFELTGELQEVHQERPVPSPEPERPGWVGELGHLNELRMAGALSDEEFARAKDKLLESSPAEQAAG